MKYIDADRLRMELEKRLKNVRDYMNGAGMRYKGPKFYKARGKESAYDALLNIIISLQQEQDLIVINKKDWEMQEQFRKNKVFGKSLQQEQPEVDLKKEFNHYCFDFKDPDTGEDIPKNQISFNVEDALNVARHFYELGLNARKEENHE